MQKMIEDGEKLLNSQGNMNYRGKLLIKESKETLTSLVPVSSDVEFRKTNKENVNSLMPYEPTAISIQSNSKHNNKKKEIIDFSTYNKYLYLKDNEFLYCKRVGNPSQFQECVYSDLVSTSKGKKNKKPKINVEYITMSKNTVMLYQNGSSYIYSVTEWIDFYVKFQKLLKIRLVKNYRINKLFDLWRKFYKKSMKTLHTEKLKKKFHHIDESLLSGLMDIRTVLKEMAQRNLFKIEVREPMILAVFQDVHKKALTDIDNMMESYRRTVKKLLEQSCAASYQTYKELKKITLEDNPVKKDKKSKEDYEKKNMKQDGNFVQNFLKDSMPYAQDATRRTHYKKLLKFIRTIDLLFNETKYLMIKNSLSSLAEKTNRLYDCYLNNWADTPWLIIDDLINKEKINYLPHMENFQDAFFKEFIQEKVYTATYTRSFIDPQEFPNYMICFEEVFETSVDQSLNLNIRIREDKEIGLILHKIKNNFKNFHSALDTYTKQLVPILSNYYKYSSIDFESLKADSHPEKLKQMLNQFLEEEKVVTAIKSKINVGMFQLHLTNLLKTVQNMPKVWIHNIRNIIPKVLVNKLNNLIGILKKHLKKLNTQVTNVETFIILKTGVKTIMEEKEQIDHKNSDINDIINIINDDKEIKIPDFEKKYIREKESLYVDFEKKLNEMTYFIENNLAKHKKELRDNINLFGKEIKKMMEEINVDTVNVYNEDYYSAIFYIENKSGIINKYLEKRDNFRKQEEDIESEDKSSFENLDNLEYEYNLKAKLWNSVSQFHERMKIWNEIALLDLPIEEMETSITSWYEIAKVGDVDLENPNVPRVLLANTQKVDKVVPLLKAFQNPHVNKEEKFVNLIKEAMDTDKTILDKTFIFEDLITHPELDSFIPKIMEFNRQADEEKRLLNIYKEIKENFDMHKIPLKIDRYSKQTNEKGSEKWIVYPQDFDLEYEWIENIMIVLKKTLMSPYASVIKDNKLHSDTKKYLDFLDEFMVFQRYSKTIDNLFAPEDIKDIPPEHKKHLNENLSKIAIKLLKDNSHLPKLVDIAYNKIMSQLQTINSNYEQLFVYIEEFLEAERKECLKYYLLSNEELIEVLSNPDSDEVKSKYVVKLIPEIKSIEIISNETDEILKVLTNDEETISLKLKGKLVRDILSCFGDEVKKKLKDSFKLLKKDYDASFKARAAKKTKEILTDLPTNRDHLAQASFNFMYSVMIDQIEKSLMSEDVFDKMIDIKLESKARRDNLISNLKSKTSTFLDRKVLINIISLEIYFNEIIKNLIREDCTNINDFNWQKILQIKIDSDTPYVKIFNSQNFEYGNEYVGLHNNFIITPQVEKVYLTIANCFTLRRPFFMYGLGESGKKETIKTLSKLFGKTILIFKCSQQFDRASFYKLFYSIVTRGSWLCLEKMDLVSNEMLSVIAQEIIDIYRVLSDKEPHLEIKSKRIDLDRNLQVICMNNITQKSPDISGNIKNYFRLIGVCVPDMSMFIQLSIKNLGLAKGKIYTKKIHFLIEYLNSKIGLLKYKRICMNLFDRVLKKINTEVSNISDENMNRYMKWAFLKTFSPFLSEEENEDLKRLIKNIFPTDMKRFTSRTSLYVDKAYGILRDLLQCHNFRGDFGDNYMNKIKEFYKSFDDTDFYLFVGPSLSGKSLAIDIVSNLTKSFRKINSDVKPIKIVKVFPKAFEPSYIFAESMKENKLQFYNMYFNNQVKLLNSLVDDEDRRVREPLPRQDNYDDEDSEDSERNKKINPIKILYLDGQIDPLWIEYLNIISGGHKVHCMPNGETIDMSDVKIVFETFNLNFASPTFITGSHVVNFDYVSYSWENVFFNWLNNNEKISANNDLKNYIRGLFENYFPKFYEFIDQNRLLCLNFKENYVIKNMISLFDALLPFFDFEDIRIGRKNMNAVPKIEIIKKSTLSIFIFTCAWTLSFFTNFILKTKIEKLISDNFRADDLKGPIFDYFIDPVKHDLELWTSILESPTMIQDTKDFVYNKVFIPTAENLPYRWIVKQYMANKTPVFYTGYSGTGKSLLINTLLTEMSSSLEYSNLRYLVTYHSNSLKMEGFIMDNLNYLKRELTGDQYDKNVILFVDDCNMQKKDEYHSQNTLECLRRLISTKNIYDMKKNLEKSLNKFNILSCANLASYPKHFLMDRVLHSFCLVIQNNFSEESLVSLFKYSLDPHIKQFVKTAASMISNQFIQSTLNLTLFMKENFKSAPSKLHYKFSLRDAGKVFQAIHKFKYNAGSEYAFYLEKLWFYETSRVFEDKLTDEEDKAKFRGKALEIFNLAYKKSYKADAVYPSNNSNSLAYLFSYNIQTKPLTKDTIEEEQEKICVSDKSGEYHYYENCNELYTKVKDSLEEYYRHEKHKHSVFNESVFNLIIRIMRVYNYNKGHLILIGPSITGKLTLSAFAGYLSNKNSVILDDSQIGSKLDSFLKNVLIETSYKNNPTVLSIGNFVLQNDDVLEAMNKLVNSREILTFYDITKTVSKELNMNLTKKDLIERIEKNLNLTFSVFPNKTSYKKIFYDYSFISKRCTTIFINKWDESMYLSIIDTSISEISNLNNRIPEFRTALSEIHHFIQKLAEDHSLKIKCKIHINSKHFTDMLTYFEENYSIFKGILETKKKKYESAIAAIGKTSEMIQIANKELEKLEPDRADIEKGIEEKKLEFSKKQLIRTQVTNQKYDEEKPLSHLSNELEELKMKLFTSLDQFEKKISNCESDITKISKNDIQQYKNYIDQHALSKLVLTQIYSFVGESSDWESVKRNLDMKYILSVVSLEYHESPPGLVNFVMETVNHPDFATSENLPKIYRITGLIADWFNSLANYFNQNELEIPLRNHINEVQKKIKEHDKVIQSHTETLNDLSKQIVEIENEIKNREKKRQLILAQIEKREILKKIGEELIEGAKDKNHLWSSKNEKVEESLNNLEVYLVYLAFFINYAGPFASSYRNKIKNFIFRKGEELTLREVRPKSFYDLMIEFLDVKNKEKDLILSLGSFDDFIRENLLLMYINKKTPYIIDNNRISKWYMSQYLQWKESKRISFTKYHETDFIEKVDTALRDGHFLFIEQSDEKIYTVMKNVIKDKREYDKGRDHVYVEGSMREINEKFKLYFIKDKVDSKINSKIWIEANVVNFFPTTDTIKSTLLKELVVNDNENNWTNYSKTLLDYLREDSKIVEIEDKMINIFSQFDYSANVDKNNLNQNLLNSFKNEIGLHNNLVSTVDTLKAKLFKFKADFNKFNLLAEDAAHIYKLMARFIMLDNVYNFSFFVYGKYIKEFYKDCIQIRETGKQKYIKDDLLLLIKYLYDKVALLFTFEQRKLLLFSLIFFYLSKKSLISSSYKQILKLVYDLAFQDIVDEETYNEVSPVKGLSDRQWRVLCEINDKSSNLLEPLLSHMREHSHSWEDYLIEGWNFTESLNLEIDELDQQVNILAKIIFYKVVYPFKVEQLMQGLFKSILGDNFKLPRLNLIKAVGQISNRKVLLIIDDDYLSEKELIVHYRRKYNYESNTFYRHFNLESEMSNSQIEIIINNFKYPHLIIIRNIQYAKQSIAKIFELLADSKHNINEGFRVIFITKSKVILSSVIYENCLLINRNMPKISNIKDIINDSLENIDTSHFDYLVNRKNNQLYSRKIVMHLLIVHAILKQYHYYTTGIYNNPIEYSKKDFLNCFYFISGYLSSIGEDKENSKDHNGNIYLNLMNIVLETFYCNRLVYKKEANRVMKILHRYFEEDKFVDENHLFLFKNHETGEKVGIKNSSSSNLSSEDLFNMINLIPLENYYEMMVSIPQDLINTKLTEFSKLILRDFCIINSKILKDEAEEREIIELNEIKKYTYKDFEKIVSQFQVKLPKIIKIIEEASPSTFKLNKNSEYVNALDESLKFEVNAYNEFLKRIYLDLEIIFKIFQGEMELDDEIYSIMIDIARNIVPLSWKEPCLDYHKAGLVTLDQWLNKLNERITILRTWLLESKLDIYYMPLFYNPRLLFYSIINFFSKASNSSPEEIELKIFFTKYYNKDDLFADENYRKEILENNKNRDVIYCSGFSLENAYLDVSKMLLVPEIEENVSTSTPLVGITYILDGEQEVSNEDDAEEDEEVEIDDKEDSIKYINVPVFAREDPARFENYEALAFIEMQYDSQHKEEVWISRAVKVTFDFK